MKKLFLLAALCVAATFSACSHDDAETPDLPDEQPLAIAFAEGNSLEFNAGETKTVHYTITGGSENTVVTAEMQTADDAYTVKTTPASATEGTIAITAKTPEAENCVVITVSDGDRSITAEITVSTNAIPEKEELAIAFEEGNSLEFGVNETKTIHYTITGGSDNTVVTAEMQTSDDAYIVETTPTSATEGTITITAKMPLNDNCVLVTASDGSQTVTAEIAVALKASFDGKTVVVETPGTLAELLADYDTTTITELTVIGNLNSSDIATLNNLPNLAVLDMENVNLEALPSSAFYSKTSLTSVKLPKTLTTIGGSAFSGCSNLTSVTIPNSVTTIEGGVFQSCIGLTSITIPNSVTKIGNSAFDGCSSLTSVYITDIAKWCAIKFTDYHANPLVHAHNLYWNGELVTELVIPDSVTSIGKCAFSRCSSLKSVTIPNSVTSIGEYAFSACSGLTNVTIPDSVTSIGSYAFLSNDSLTSVTIGNGVTTIGTFAFSACSGLTNVTLGNSVTKIGDGAFTYCYKLTSIYCKAQTPPTIGFSAYFYWGDCTLYVPTGCKEAYAAADEWKLARQIIEMTF